MSSPFLEIPIAAHVASNALAFAVRDKYPVSDGHTLVVPRRLIVTWFDATPEERAAIFELVDVVKSALDQSHHPDGYNVGFNAGAAAGQTVMHLHVHVIPRYRHDMDDPRGGVRHVIPSKGNYLLDAKPLATGGEDDPFARHIFPLLRKATKVAIVAAFVQESGLDRIHAPLHEALGRGARIRLLTGDYLGITQAAALQTLHDWQAAPADEEEGAPAESGRLEVRVIETQRLPARVRSFHPKSWRFVGPDFATAYVGSSNLSFAALGSGVEWNLRVDRDRDANAYARVESAFEALWKRGRVLDPEWVAEYARRARERPQALPPGELLEDEVRPLPPAHAEQATALDRLRAARAEGRDRAMLVFATGLGKTLVAVRDYEQLWDESGRPHPPKLLFLAHRRELLLQAARAFRALLRERGANGTVGWAAEASSELHADLVFGSVAKLARASHLEALGSHRFDYVVVDEVHHAAASSYRKILDALEPGFTLGLTATPERADGADVVGLFDDFVAHRAGIGEGIQLGRLVPFQYFGVKDTIDYANIPWRNRRFDAEELTRAAETEARMETLWRTWEAHPGARTLVFCCSITHALFVKRWLETRGVIARAIHSDPSSDERTEALEDLAAGTIQAVCAVDVLNEGVDVPAVDRVVMLRPTESNVVFLQQLGRGLRAHAESGKRALTVIDFVGNHRMFLERLRTLFSLGASTGAHDLRRLLDGDAPEGLPEGCRIEIEIEAKELLSRLFRGDGNEEVERAYRELAASREERPRAGELYRMGYSVGGLRRRHGSWFEFVGAEGHLSDRESAALSIAGAFLAELEVTAMTKCFKMVVLQALIEHDALADGMPVEELARRSHRVLRRDPVLLADVPPAHREPPPGRAWEGYWRQNPIEAWTTSGAKGRAWFRVDEDRFVPTWESDETTKQALASMVAELVDLRLAQYRQRTRVDGDRQSFTCRLTWNKRDPILKLPSRAHHELPTGNVDARLEDGRVWVFRFAQEFCNVARPAGADRNQLPDLLRGWFGPSAGHPGTSFQVRFEAGPDGWTVVPERGAQVIALPRRSIAAYPDLRAAAGHTADATLTLEQSAVELPIESEAREMLFAVRVAGTSMDGGRRPLRDGDWAVFRLARGASAQAVQGRVALVQVPHADEGHGHQIKRVLHRQGQWRLASDNPSGPEIVADPSMVVIAKLERSFHPEELAPERGAHLAEDELADAFGLTTVEPREGRHGGHLFLFVTERGRLPTPSHVAPRGGPRPGETAYVLAKASDDRWQYLGVGHWDAETSRWRIPEVDVATWKAYGASGGVSRELPPEARARAQEVVDVLASLPELERWIGGKSGRARITGTASRGGLRIEGMDTELGERTVSLTDLAWVGVALDDVEEKGGRLDEARVNRLRYLEGTPKGSTRFIDTAWAIAAWSRAAPWLREASGVMRVHGADGTPLDARFEVERVGGELSLVFHSRGGTRGSAEQRNVDYAAGLDRLLDRLRRHEVEIVDAFVESTKTRELSADARRLDDGIEYPLRVDDVEQTRKALMRAMAKVGRSPGAKGGGNQTKRIRLMLRSDERPKQLATRLAHPG